MPRVAVLCPGAGETASPRNPRSDPPITRTPVVPRSLARGEQPAGPLAVERRAGRGALRAALRFLVGRSGPLGRVIPSGVETQPGLEDQGPSRNKWGGNSERFTHSGSPTRGSGRILWAHRHTPSWGEEDDGSVGGGVPAREPGEDMRGCGVQSVPARVFRGGPFSSWGAGGEPSSRASGPPGLGGPGVGRWVLCTDWAPAEWTVLQKSGTTRSRNSKSRKGSGIVSREKC